MANPTEQSMRVLGGRITCASLLLVLSVATQGCCPGCSPLLADHQRVHSYAERTGLSAPEAMARFTAWLDDPALSQTDTRVAFNPRIGRSDHVDGTGAHRLIARMPSEPALRVNFWGYCAAPPAPQDDPLWNLRFNMEVRFADDEVRFELKDIFYCWPMLGDNPSALTHGHKRAPKNTADLASIEKHCLGPLKDQWMRVIARAP